MNIAPTRRELFAAAALQGLLADDDGQTSLEDLVDMAWKIADLMIAREPRKT